MIVSECIQCTCALLLVEEPGLEGASSTATLTIQRAAGTFTEVTVDWEVTTSSAGSDISPISGGVTFSEGQTTGTFTVSALEDEVHNVYDKDCISLSKTFWCIHTCRLHQLDVFFKKVMHAYSLSRYQRTLYITLWLSLVCPVMEDWPVALHRLH